jgi:LmbE family N-acetylglucosaminyl deacetylase
VEGIASLPQLRPAELGAVVVIAPHPDDESIGCGGLIALLRRLGQPVDVLLLSDGALSHPRSVRWPRPARVRLRLAEFHAALRALGVEAHHAQALQWPDGALPDAGGAGFDAAVAELAACLAALAPSTLLVPWRRDPHPDHRAASAIARAANAGLARPARLLEYPIWTAERGTDAEFPALDEATRWQLDVAAVGKTKLQAIAAHRSQLGGVIDDDPGGFVLPPVMLARCAQPFETFYEVKCA